MNLKMAPFPLSCWKAAGIFSSIYWICSSSWRQISPYCGSLPFDKVPLWFVCTEPPEIHQYHSGFPYRSDFPQQFPLLEHRCSGKSQFPVFVSLSPQSLQLGFVLCPPLCYECKKSRWFFCQSVQLFSLWFGWTGEVPSSLNGQLETHRSYSSVDGPLLPVFHFRKYCYNEHTHMSPVRYLGVYN